MRQQYEDFKQTLTPKRKIKRVRAVKKGNKLNIFHLERLVRDGKNIGRLLINNFVREEEFNDIHLLAIKELRKGLNSFYGTWINKELIFISLSIIALEMYDGVFYEHVEAVYEDLVNEYGIHRVEGLIRDTLRCYSSDEDPESSRLINSVIKNTLVPLPFLGNYFEFCFDIYEKNFDYSIPEDLGTELKTLFAGIKEATATDGDGITIIGLNNGQNKSYKLIRATKQIISEETDIEELIWLTSKVLEIIDHYYWKGKTHTPNNYFRKGFKAWVEKYESSQEGADRNNNRRSQWVCQFRLLDSNQIILKTPTHTVSGNYNWETIRIYVFNGGELIKECSQLDIRQVVGYYRIQPQEIVIDNPLGHLVYKVIAGSDELYSSKDRLERDVLVFDESGNEIDNHTDYEGVAYICSADGDLGNRISRQDCFSLYEMDAKPGAHFKYGKEANQVFVFSNSIDPTLIGSQAIDCFAVLKNSRKKTDIFRCVDAIQFETENNEIPLISINNNELPLAPHVSERLELIGKTRWTVKCLLDAAGEYDIKLYSCVGNTKKTMKQWYICIDPDFDFSFEGDNADLCANIEIASSFLEEAIKTYKVSYESFNEDAFAFSMCGKQWYWLLPVDFPIYRLDGGPWKAMETNHLWIGDIKSDSIVEIYHTCKNIIPRTPSIDEFEEVKIKNQLSKDWPFAEIGFLLNFTEYPYIDLSFMGENWEVLNCLRCYNKVTLDEQKTSFVFDRASKTLIIDPVLIGRGKIKVVIRCENATVHSQEFDSLDEIPAISISPIKSFVPYAISFFYVEQKLLGSTELLVEKINKAFFCEEDFLNKTFRIQSVEFERLDHSGSLLTKCMLNNTYIQFDRFEDGIFEGNMLYKTQAGESHWLNGLNPVYIEVCSEIHGNTIDLAIVKPIEDYGSMKSNYRKGDGLLLKVPDHARLKGEIIDGMDNKNAPDILTYHMTI